MGLIFLAPGRLDPGERKRTVLTVISILTILMTILAGCATPPLGNITQVWTTNAPTFLPTHVIKTITPTTVIPQKTPTIGIPAVWISPALPTGFTTSLNFPSDWMIVNTRNESNIQVETVPLWKGSSNKPVERSIHSFWTYALVVPFPTVSDSVRLEDIRNAWRGNLSLAPGNQPLLMTLETQRVLESIWGNASPKGTKIVEPGEILSIAWQQPFGWAVVPFDDIEPRWKVLSVEGQSPLDLEFDDARYPLSVPIWLNSQLAMLESRRDSVTLPSNRDPKKFTVLVMTGVTALSRHIGEVMETKGVTYPASDIGRLLAEADLTHISNEVSFYQNCPKPGPERADMRFCSQTKYIELLKAVGTDIVELTGNHNIDWGFQPYFYTLDLYQQLGWKTYGGGRNLTEAQKPLLIEHNGNKIAFLGCSPAGPESVWATNDEPGSAPCNMDRLEKQIFELINMGYLPVVSFQAVETDSYVPSPAQGSPNFRRMARAGAVIVSGSQSHIPQTMTFVNQSFVHYGLGNLFFDQMTPPEARQAFIDRHIFYSGRYINVELITTFLEEYARPRPMTSIEREELLKNIFNLSDWSGQ